MDGIQIVLLIIFVIATVAGYFLIKNVPALLHTPLMSGMNAMAGVVLTGALTAAGVALNSANETVAAISGCVAVALAMINVAGGFDVTDRMLKMFEKKPKE